MMATIGTSRYVGLLYVWIAYALRQERACI